MLAVVVSTACGAAQRPGLIAQPAEALNPTIPVAELNTPVLEPDLTSTTTTEAPVPTTEAPTTTEPAAPPTTAGYLREQATSSDLAAIRYCESRNNYATDTGNGYYGAYQFSLSTWESVGGSGNPANASPSEQDMRAQMLIDAGYRSAWPNC